MNKINNLLMIIMFMYSSAFAAENRVDGQRPDAPELAMPGDYKVGVRTIQLSHKDQIDVVNVNADNGIVRYNRPLTIEVWYPADTEETGGTYKDVYLRDGATQVDLYGSAVRNADPFKSGPYPLVIISHGYPGNRFLMSHFGENLASKGYVAVAIDHTDSNYQDAGAFGSTLLNRPLDQKFVLNEMARFSVTKDHFLHNMIDDNKVGLIGYSMGGYGAMITAGAGVTDMVAGVDDISPMGILKHNVAGTDSHKALLDDRFKAIIAISPWGMGSGFWNDQGLAGATKPIFFISGGVDDVSGYETGTKLIYEKVVNTDRYLLTFEHANHNAAAPIPAPKEAWNAVYNNGESVAFSHYADPVWDQLRMNNIAQHFVTAYFGLHLKADAAMGDYLNLIPNGNDGSGETQWKGFAPRTAKGLKLEHLKSGH